jgi:hypothetical protein
MDAEHVRDPGEYRERPRFAKIVGADHSGRTPKSLESLVHAVRPVYDQKTVDDRNDSDVTKPSYRSPNTSSSGPCECTAAKGCWDVFMTAHFDVLLPPCPHVDPRPYRHRVLHHRDVYDGRPG